MIPAGYSWSFADQQGTQGPLTLLNQTPDSLFWDVDALGYIFLSLSPLIAAPHLLDATAPADEHAWWLVAIT